MAAGVMLSAKIRTHAPGKVLLFQSRKPGREMRGAALKVDLRYNGWSRIDGTTAVAGPPDVPVVRKVRLYHVDSGANMARELWSNADGSYSFQALARGPWLALAHDHTHTFNAVVADNRLGDPM